MLREKEKKLGVLRKMKILLLCVVAVLGLALLCSDGNKRPIRGFASSYHFDGEKFYNPTLPEGFDPTLLDILRMLREERARWPKRVPNLGNPRLEEELKKGSAALTFVGHATFLIQLQGLNILVDPVWSERASPVSWAGPRRVREPALKQDDLPRIDVVLITHNHYDHLDMDTLSALSRRFSPLVLAPLGDGNLLKSYGINDVIEMDWWESVKLDYHTQITFTPVQHTSGRSLFNRARSLWGSFFIKQDGISLYLGGDSGYSRHYLEIAERLGPPDVALLPIGSYLPRWFMQPVHMDPKEAIKAHNDLKAKVSIGMHFGTFQLSAEGFHQPVEELKEALKEGLLAGGRFIVLNEGDTFIYPKDMGTVSLR
ncbi:hypothetical protein Tlie_1903 (plasmid) [Thermovirga lienii DSM 17291]|uniref:Metallo-beta-lactamase domain-containing protein n=1 Tax=Thermovirga lienii (strain ATCC BAA-1197 / DSM 17291 / Cas60314) TaxID=580340 RepID=G7VAG1_THELD|nr:hypothetical protein Tlie_1903 [Thermovirga lienii DSM 17291]MDN5319420.1 hypothetical protein [Thermovirga sp.]MDN5368677.1 hypothetical protein [Thermovirga sp.]